MTRGQIAEQILRLISGGDQTAESQISLIEIMYAMDQERDRLVGEYYKARIARGERAIDGSVLQRYTLTPAEDTRLSLWYVDLPEKVISLPDDMGIYQVQEPGYLGNTYIRKPAGHNQLYSLSKAKSTTASLSYSGSGEGHIYWWLESSTKKYRLYFSAKPHLPTGTLVATTGGFNGGTGYAVNDTFTLSGTGTGGVITVVAVDGSGTITSASYSNLQNYTGIPDVTYDGGSGTDATFSFEMQGAWDTLDVLLLTSISMHSSWNQAGMDITALEGGTNFENYPLPAELVAPLIRNVAQLYGVMADKQIDTTQDNQKKV